jgi:cytochrome P450
VCLGQRIANMQLETAYKRILDRFPNIEWTGQQRHAPNNFVNAISHLEVDLGVN